MTCQNSYLQKISKNGNYSRYYVERFIGMKCAVDLLSLRMFPNAKEVTESFGCFEGVVNNIEDDLKNEEINIVCVGDGHTPRTAAMFAFRSNWNCYSVDPVLRPTNASYRVNRLKTYSKRIEDVKLSFDSPTIIVHCHAHVSIPRSLAQISAPKLSVLAIECCVSQRIDGVKPDIEYVDNCIWSKKNTVRIWKNLNQN